MIIRANQIPNLNFSLFAKTGYVYVMKFYDPSITWDETMSTTPPTDSYTVTLTYKENKSTGAGNNNITPFILLTAKTK